MAQALQLVCHLFAFPRGVVLPLNPGSLLDRLRHVIDHAAHVLPAQGPIGVFIHHNTLHAFEHLPFDQAVVQAAKVYGCQPYLSENRFRLELEKGRITRADLEAVLEDHGDGTQMKMKLAMLLNKPWRGTAEETHWKIAEEQVSAREPKLWEACLGFAQTDVNTTDAPPMVRPRDAAKVIYGVDADDGVHECLARYCAAYLDQGMADNPVMDKTAGFFRQFCTLESSCWHPDGWRRELRNLCRIESTLGRAPMESILASLTALGIGETDWDAFLTATFLALRGWAGLIRHVAERPDRVAQAIPAEAFHDFVAVRLLMDRAAIVDLLRDNGVSQSVSLWWADQRLRHGVQVRRTPEQSAYTLFQVARVLGRTGVDAAFAEAVFSFTRLERRKMFHLAYERRLRMRTLEALAHRVKEPVQRIAAPAVQVVTCLDEREESFRRHLEETSPTWETFGAAGFFAMPMYYRGAAEAHNVPLCPVVMKPSHWVREVVDERIIDEHERNARRREQLGRVALRAHLGSRRPVMGGIISAALGALASVPLVARVLWPRLTSRLRRSVGKLVRTPPQTKLLLERTSPKPGPGEGELGWSVAEMVVQSERLLRDIGLTHTFAPLVFILGHGSGSLNNPHKSAYDCGACGGNPGAPNARAIAQLLNDPRVRAGLVERGLHIPATTWFIGGYHNTCDDSVTLTETEHVPAELVEPLVQARLTLKEGCMRNAQERCRRFESCPLSATPPEAHRHVEGRSEDLAQARPELGHATNAVCIVGRRERSRGLYFDRRAFLVSYDPTQDTPEGMVLGRTLGAVFPVCGGINLEYFFSHVDPAGYGCGTKLPHNITSLLGVVDGAGGDLRTGLPWQMTEIHEPVRLLIVIEATEELFRKLMKGNRDIDVMTRNGWVQVVLMHPETGRFLHYDRDGFRAVLPDGEPMRRVRTSAEWYVGKRQHLEFVEVASGGRA